MYTVLNNVTVEDLYATLYIVEGIACRHGPITPLVYFNLNVYMLINVNTKNVCFCLICAIVYKVKMYCISREK